MSSPTLQGGVRLVSVWSQARAGQNVFDFGACVFGRLPGNSLRFLPPTQAASEQKGKKRENLGGISADATLSPSAVRVPRLEMCQFSSLPEFQTAGASDQTSQELKLHRMSDLDVVRQHHLCHQCFQ